MIIFNELKTYSFKNIHIPRIYLNDFDQVNDLLVLLKKHKYLNNNQIPSLVGKSREESSREIFILLWRLNFGVEIVRDNKLITYKFTEKLDEFIDKEKKYKKYFYKYLFIYLPLSSVLNFIYRLNQEKKNYISEKIIVENFHKKYNKGNADNVHPMSRMLKGLNLVSKNYEVSNEGKKILEKCSEVNPIYFHQKNEVHDDFEILILEIMHQLSLNDISKFKIDDISKLNFLSKFHQDLLSKEIPEKIFNKLRNLEEKYPIKVDGGNCIILNPIFFDIKPSAYINKNLNKNFKIKDKTEKVTYSLDFEKYQPITIFNQKNNIKIKNCKNINYDEFHSSCHQIINAAPKFIILDKGWSPIANVKISGFLDAYVRFGGNLIIIDSSKGRLGSNRGQFSWLPQELSKLQYFTKGYFKFTSGERLMTTKKISHSLLNNNSGEYKKLVLSYHKGTFTFISSKVINKLNFSDKFYSSKISINANSTEWKNANIHHICANIKGGERKLYKPIRNFMENNFRFKFPENWSDNATTDVFSILPFKCLFEVDTVGENHLFATDFKITEVDKHYRHMKSGKKKLPGLDLTIDVRKCVIGYDFSTQEGQEKLGAIETAKLYDVNLIRYRDLYDMSCMDLNHEDLKKLLFDWDGEPEVSKKLQRYI